MNSDTHKCQLDQKLGSKEISRKKFISQGKCQKNFNIQSIKNILGKICKLRSGMYLIPRNEG